MIESEFTADEKGETGMVLGTGKERPLPVGREAGSDPEARFESASLHQIQATEFFAAIDEVEQALIECEAYFDNRAYGASEEMKLLQTVRAALKALGRAK